MTTSIIINSLGLVLDILGFISISYTIIKPKKPKNNETTDIQDVFGKSLSGNLVNLDYLKSDIFARLGFWSIIIGFSLQLLGNLINLYSL